MKHSSSVAVNGVWGVVFLFGLGLRGLSGGFKVQGLEFRVWGARFRVQGLGFRVYRGTSLIKKTPPPRTLQ